MPSHRFKAIAFPENVSMRELAAAFPEAARNPHELRLPATGEGVAYVYPFGAACFQDLTPAEHEAARSRLSSAFPQLHRVVAEEEIAVVEEAVAKLGVTDGVLKVDRLTAQRASVVAMILAQSAAMTYYETIQDGMFASTNTWISRLQRRGTAPLRTRPLHRFIGEAIGVRNEVLSVLHLLDKPDDVWEDATLDAIYADLRAEFDLGDRFHSLELKLRSVQESLELVLDVVRDRRMVILEATIVALIVGEIVLSLLR